MNESIKDEKESFTKKENNSSELQNKAINSKYSTETIIDNATVK